MAHNAIAKFEIPELSKFYDNIWSGESLFWLTTLNDRETQVKYVTLSTRMAALTYDEHYIQLPLDENVNRQGS